MPRENWHAVARALNDRMRAGRVGQQELADLAGVSVATVRVLQRGGGGRRVQDATLGAVSRALGWPVDYLLCVALGRPLPENGAEPRAVVTDPQVEILVVLRRIERHVETLVHGLIPASTSGAAETTIDADTS